MAKKKRLRRKPRRELCSDEREPITTDEEFIKLYRENFEKQPGEWANMLIRRYALSRSPMLEEELRKVYELVSDQYPEFFDELLIR